MARVESCVVGVIDVSGDEGSIIERLEAKHPRLKLHQPLSKPAELQPMPLNNRVPQSTPMDMELLRGALQSSWKSASRPPLDTGLNHVPTAPAVFS